MTNRTSSIVTIGSMQKAAEAAGYAFACGPDFDLPALRLKHTFWRRGLAHAAIVMMAGMAAVSWLVV